HFLLWQSAQIAAEVRVLFDPDTLPSRLFPRPRALNTLLEMLNQPDLADAWRADETIGWIYQYFNEPELQAAFEKVRTSRAKFEAKDIPSATQLFTPHWIVRFLVQNTLGRLWVQMHPDTHLVGTDPSTLRLPSGQAGSGHGLLDYLVPLEGEIPPEPLRPVREITLLDPACGAMHFGLVAFDLLAAMYQEELDRAGEPGWPETPSVADPADIPAAIIKHNLFGIDIDLRAVQLSALALYLKAKYALSEIEGSLNPKARITDSNLACADVLPLDGARLGTFLREARFTRPVYERLIRALWSRLQDVDQLGSLLRLERELGDLITEERARYDEAPLFAGLPGEFEREAAEAEFWEIISAQTVQGLDEFTRQQAQAGVDQTFFAGEAVKGLRLVELMLRRYDVVVTNPPYMTRGKMNNELAKLVADAYPEGKNDLFAAFIQRCLEFAEDRGYVGMLTMHSFMFIRSYEALRGAIRREAAVEAMAHCGPGLFEVGNPGTLQTAAFAIRKEPETLRREANVGTYFRLVHAPTGDGKRQALEQALRDGSNTYRLAQRRFDAIPGSPWVYWVNDTVRNLFETLPKLEDIAPPKHGRYTGDNFRFLRFWWEVGKPAVAFGCRHSVEAMATGKRWVPYMKGGEQRRWYGNQEYVTNWLDDGKEQKAFPGSGERNPQYYFREGATFPKISSAGFSARYMPPGFIASDAGTGLFPALVSATDTVGIVNSKPFIYLLQLTSVTLNFQVGELAKVPVPLAESSLKDLATQAVQISHIVDLGDETTFDFTVPPHWGSGLDDLAAAQSHLAALEAQIDDKAYRLYGISDEGRAAIEAELAGEPITDEDDTEYATRNTDDQEEPEPPMTVEELAVHWISYAVGIVLERFQPGVLGELGSAVYRRADFAVGSLPVPDEAEFDQLVGPPERFAYIDEADSRHLFSAEVESTLRDLAVPDGITVLDEGHPRDLPALVERALVLMLGEESAQEVIAEGAGGDPSAPLRSSLRRFFERHFF
ncbi:MAG: BREX-1 system adenine-specific DNA-methyltransferase PglX, partial [Promethearchaeota archaeon]